MKSTKHIKRTIYLSFSWRKFRSMTCSCKPLYLKDLKWIIYSKLFYNNFSLCIKNYKVVLNHPLYLSLTTIMMDDISSPYIYKFTTKS